MVFLLSFLFVIYVIISTFLQASHGPLKDSQLGVDGFL